MNTLTVVLALGVGALLVLGAVRLDAPALHIRGVVRHDDDGRDERQLRVGVDRVAVGFDDVDRVGAVRAATLDSLRAIMMIRAYRMRGHLAADLDPLRLKAPESHPELDPATYGFTAADMDRPIFLDKVLGLEFATIRQITDILKRTYCGTLGVEFMHISDPEQKAWIQERIEGRDKEIVFTPQGKVAILNDTGLIVANSAIGIIQELRAKQTLDNLAIVGQAQKYLHMSGTDFYYGPEIELAERLANLAPGVADKRVFFCNSGAEANEGALKLARYATGRHRVISCYGAFHGRTYGAMSLGGSKSLHRSRSDGIKESESALPQLLKDRQHHHTVQHGLPGKRNKSNGCGHR